MTDIESLAHFDRTALANLVEDVGEDALPEILETFLTEIPRRILDLEAAVAADDAVRAAHEAHAIKGSAAFLGMTRLRNLAFAVEMAGKGHNGAALRLLAPRIAVVARDACEALRAELP